MTPGIEFDHVWKKFRRGERHDSLRDLVPALLRRLGGAGGDLRQGDFWALQDVSFEVHPGQALGIIGHNGAGKSTTLKALTKIIRPTRGRCAVRGRVGALIEIAAGFHPDLTGRENVALQGAIMGMRGADIQARFDQIVEFAGVQDFIDTPVKRYSSGMNARLGFSIAAHLEPDVLIIDEVLSVGDFTFQRRAFDRVRALARSGIPVVVVSHQLDRIADLCTHAMLLERGRVKRFGSPSDCIAEYTSGGTHRADADAGDCPVRLLGLELLTPGATRSGDRLTLRIEGDVDATGVPPNLDPLDVRIRSTSTGEVLYAFSAGRAGLVLRAGERFAAEVSLQMNFPPGVYGIETSVWDRMATREAFSGPSLHVVVEEQHTFYGSVQCNATFREVPLREAVRA